MKALQIARFPAWVRGSLLAGFITGALLLSGAPVKATEAAAAHTNSAALELNAGKKWTVDKPMMAHLRRLEKAVTDFDRNPKKDHAAMAKDIEHHLGKLVTNCTMEGKAHDELHKWLMPFLALSADYSRAAERAVQQQKFREIQQALQAFNQYFE